MFRRLLLAAVFLGSASAATAQPQDAPIIQMPGREPPPRAGPRVRLFISPMGEPFRGPDGFGAWLAGADTDHDGAVTPAEFRADGERFFKLLDADGNGFIDGFEIQAYERERVPEIGTLGIEDTPRGGPRAGGGGGGRRGGGGMGGGGGGGMGGGGGRRGGGGMGGGGHGGGGQDDQADKPQDGAQAGFRGVGREGASRFSLLNIPEPVAQCDEDGNGRVTLTEWGRAETRRFEMLDKAKAGKLTRDGLRPPPPAGKKR
jgi:hypothetical protein